MGYSTNVVATAATSTIYREWKRICQWRTGEGGVCVQTLPAKFRCFDKAEPTSQFHGKYIRNNLIRI
jgi:hypothetical protein